MNYTQHTPRPIPAKAGVGLKPEHYQAIIETKPDIGWFEIIPENYMAEGGAVHHYMHQIRESYPLSIHGIGLSLGSEEGVCSDQLAALKKLIDCYQPALVSEHLSWSKKADIVLNDLLPVPYTKEAMDVFTRNIDQTQNFLDRQIMIENPSSYFQLDYSVYSEWDFLVTLAKRSGAKILLDINNIYVSAFNHGFDAKQYIKSVPKELVGEIHLAGHSVHEMRGGKVLIDDHGSKVISQVWHLYEYALEHIGNRPTLIEWDANIPDWEVLFEQAKIADQMILENSSVLA
jgi:uncharacterized protein (UPF0276 family)